MANDDDARPRKEGYGRLFAVLLFLSGVSRSTLRNTEGKISTTAALFLIVEQGSIFVIRDVDVARNRNFKNTVLILSEIR